MLPKSWDPAAMESAIYQKWLDAGYFTADPTSTKPAYSIVLPPPNVTGSLHMGHALEHTMMDALTRRKRMQGYEVLWQRAPTMPDRHPERGRAAAGGRRQD